MLGIFSASAQTIPGRISGTITDSSGASVAGARITITNDATALKWEALTDDCGLYLAANLPVGTYNVDVEAAGFRKAEKQGYDLVDDGRITGGYEFSAPSTSISIRSSAAPNVLPCASIRSDKVPPPPSASCSRKFNAPRFGNS
jgi:hypothetical protein